MAQVVQHQQLSHHLVFQIQTLLPVLIHQLILLQHHHNIHSQISSIQNQLQEDSHSDQHPLLNQQTPHQHHLHSYSDNQTTNRTHINEVTINKIINQQESNTFNYQHQMPVLISLLVKRLVLTFHLNQI